MVRLAIGDSHDLTRRGVRHFLEKHLDIEIAVEARSESALISLIRERGESLDALLLDPELSNSTSVDLIHTIQCESKSLPILIFSSRKSCSDPVKLMRAGARGYLDKTCSTDELLTAILKVASGGLYVSEEMAENLAFSLINSVKAPTHICLSAREFEVFMLLVNGVSVTKIAALMKLSVKTVSTHKTRVMRRMNFQSICEMVRYAIANDLLHGPE